MEKPLNELQTLGDLLTSLFALRRLELLFQFRHQLIEIDFLKDITDGFRAHLSNKRVTELLLSFTIFSFRQQLLGLQRGLPFINDEVILIIDHPLQIPCRHVHHQAQPARHTFVEPDVTDRHSQLDMPHPLTANTCEGNLDTATITNHPFKLDPLIFSA